DHGMGHVRDPAWSRHHDLTVITELKKEHKLF
ncbi:hypothetical protein ig2599ANME_0016, partial [groundwater metagenome]